MIRVAKWIFKMFLAGRVVSILFFINCAAGDQILNQYIRHYEVLSYNRVALHNNHLRAKRALSPQDKMVRLDFYSHGRHFNLRMTRDVSTFSPDAVEEVDGVEMPLDTSHIYSGDIFGDEGSLAHGSVVDGRFEGFIKTHHGTFYVEPSERYIQDEKNVPFHSVIYHEDNIDYPHKDGVFGGCANHSILERMKRYQNSAVEEVDHAFEEENLYGPVILRRKRATENLDTCPLFIQTDHFFYRKFGSREAVLAQISSHVKSINTIYRATNFGGIKNIGFIVKRIKINTTAQETDPTNPFRFVNIGVEKFLELNSEQIHDNYCLAYIFTDRDFDDGVLGLAWVGSAAGGAGGICEKSKLYSDGRRKSLNTGIITIRNYNAYVPPKITHLTFAHEVGHNFGSPHDAGPECTPGESSDLLLKAKGNFIMYSKATSGDKPNNNKFSVCSIQYISDVLKSKKDICFVESGLPICGNKIVEDGEQCDCGYMEECDDPCCYDADQDESIQCKLQPGKLCSPSQGPCCTEECTYMNATNKCRTESECAKDGFCDGTSAMCPPLIPKEDLSICNLNTQVCISGSCSGSICQRYGLEACSVPIAGGRNDALELCHVHCMEKLRPDTCSSSGSVKWAEHFNNINITLQPGSPCNDFNGYCDVFSRCRRVDADGPLLRLRKVLFDTQLYETIVEWVVAHWWAVLLIGLALILLMAGFIKLCSVKIPTSNPRMPEPWVQGAKVQQYQMRQRRW
ncbi:disintegrin and metalloproteinase domain-containing protein 10-like [Synchiropus picturatus]